MGFVLAVLITSAKVDDGVAAVMLFEKIDPIKHPRFGDARKGNRARGAAGKVPVFGCLERKGNPILGK